MPSLPILRKVGLVACSGEEIPEGTVTRLAALRVLHELRRGETVTICLPLFLAGGEGDRAFAKLSPTITIDGCALRCAARGTETYSAKPAASLVVSELLTERGLPCPGGRRRLDEAGRQAVDVTAARIVELVDQVMGSQRQGQPIVTPPPPEEEGAVGSCACGSGVPVKKLRIAGRLVEVVALPPILDQFRGAGREPGEPLASSILEMVKVYNEVTPGDEPAWREALLREYVALLGREKNA